MRYVSVLFFLFACSPTKKGVAPSNFSESAYEVSKIDSLNSYYFVYLKRGDSIFKVVSRKESVSNCKQIALKQKYSFELVSIWNKPLIINGMDVSLSNTPHVNCIGLDDTTKVCLERSLGINDIFHAKNLRGLCFF